MNDSKQEVLTKMPVPTNTENKALAKKTLRDMIEDSAFQDQLSKALPKHLSPDRFARVVITAMNKTPKLRECEATSFFNCLLTLSQLGLEPDGRRAHLIPFNRKIKEPGKPDRWVVDCQLIVDYKGIVELIMNAGDVANVHAEVICQNDEFVYDKGEIKAHKINFREPRGEVYAAYALIRFKDGTEKVEVMTKTEIEAIRKRSKTYDAEKDKSSGPWATDWNEMAKKTVFRRASKWVKISPEQRDIIEADDDQYHEPAIPRRDTGAELASRMTQQIQEPTVVVLEHNQDDPEPAPVTSGELSGDRLFIWETLAERTAGSMIEMNALLKSLSGGKVTNQQDLEKAPDSVIKDIVNKIAGKK